MLLPATRLSRAILVVAALALVGALAVPLTRAAQAPSAPTPAAQPGGGGQKPTFATGTAAVLLDVIIRDKKGRPVLDIKPEELEVYEEGVKQTVDSFKRVEGEAPTVQAAPAAGAPPDSSRQLNLVTFVFDQLGETGRRLAQKAAASFLDKGLRPNTFVAVFRVDNRLSMVQPFTNDREKLKEAIARSTSGTFLGVTDEKAALDQALSELQRTAGLDEATGPGAAAQGANFAARAQAQALSNMLRLANDLQRQQQGSTSLYPLLGLVKGQATLAGRKTMLYFAERLEVPSNLDQVFRSVISEANRANVSVYTVDARGLNVGLQASDLDRPDSAGAMADAKAALDEARNVSMQTMQSRGGGAVSKDQIKLSEKAEDALRKDVEGVFRDLAEGTGGFSIANTNNFKPGTERIANDISSYYELSYTPPPSPFDGRFRKIEVKTSRPDVVVQTRSGYFALPPGTSSALFPYEVPLLAALSAVEGPKDFDIRTAALRFESTPAGLDHKILVEVPISDLKMVLDTPPPPAVGRYRVHFSLLALVKGANGDVVERYSEDYPFAGPADRADALKMGNVVFKRRVALPPGKYTLDVAAEDRETGKIATRHTPFEVPAAGPGPMVSSLALIRRIDQIPADTKSDDPLDFPPARIVPNLDAPISLAANSKLWLFFLTYPSKAGGAPKMTLEFARDGHTIAKAEAPMPAPDADGNIRYVGNFPTASFTPGKYDVHVTVSQGAGASDSRTAFTIVP
jgi:VWFA-related protein